MLPENKNILEYNLVWYLILSEVKYLRRRRIIFNHLPHPRSNASESTCSVGDLHFGILI